MRLSQRVTANVEKPRGTFDPTTFVKSGDAVPMPETIRDPRPHEPEQPLPWPKPGILVGLDGSAPSAVALRKAAEMAPKLGLPLHAVIVWDYPALVSGEYYYPDEYLEPGQGAAEVIASAAEQVFGDAQPEWFTWSLRRGRAARELVELSKRAELLVVGGRGHGGFAGLILGSVSDACAAHAHCPVLIVHDR